MDAAKTDADRNQQSFEDRVQAELEDNLDEELELELGDDLLARLPARIADTRSRRASTADATSPSCCAFSAS